MGPKLLTTTSTRHCCSVMGTLASENERATMATRAREAAMTASTSRSFLVRRVVMTKGWQRFTHFVSLCPLPLGPKMLIRRGHGRARPGRPREGSSGPGDHLPVGGVGSTHVRGYELAEPLLLPVSTQLNEGGVLLDRVLDPAGRAGGERGDQAHLPHDVVH